MNKYDPLLTSFNYCEPVWTSVDQCEPVWISVDQCEPVSTSMNVWTSVNQYQPVWISVDQREPGQQTGASAFVVHPDLCQTSHLPFWLMPLSVVTSRCTGLKDEEQTWLGSWPCLIKWSFHDLTRCLSSFTLSHEGRVISRDGKTT